MDLSDLPGIFTGVLADEVSIYLVRKGETRVKIDGVFRERYEAQDAGDLGEFDGSFSSVAVAAADAVCADDAQIHRAGKAYKIISQQPDGKGMLLLILRHCGDAPPDEV